MAKRENLAPQAPFDLGHQAVGEAQGTEGLLQGLGGLLRLKVVTFEALSGMKAAALSGFGMFFRVSCAGGHGVRLCSVWGLCGCGMPMRDALPHFLLSFAGHMRYIEHVSSRLGGAVVGL